MKILIYILLVCSVTLISTLSFAEVRGLEYADQIMLELDEMAAEMETTKLTEAEALLCIGFLNQYASIVENKPQVRLFHSDKDKDQMKRLIDSFNTLGCNGK